MLKYVFIVEDTCAHFDAAIAARDARGLKDILDWDVTTDLKGFKRWLGELLETVEYKNGEVGVLTDLFFPASEISKHKEDLAPLGLIVMAECQRYRIPCVIVTAGHHHGKKYQSIFTAAKLMGWPEMVDSNDYSNIEGEVEKKDWEKALSLLEEATVKTGAG
ncbi:MAG: hypothetical protein Q7R90_03425 [bacterium]|nr:hypothetical protein [bacterium]